MARPRGVVLKDTSLRRFRDHKPVGRPLALAVDHPAVTGARTLFPSTVRNAAGRLLKSGHHQRKIGRRIQKGKWRGFEVYALTLEERATCPSACKHFRDWLRDGDTRKPLAWAAPEGAAGPAEPETVGAESGDVAEDATLEPAPAAEQVSLTEVTGQAEA